MSSSPLYRSDRSLKSLGQRYDVYDDRFELETLLGSWTIPFTEVAAVTVQEARLQALVNGRVGLMPLLLGFKLDCADLTEHVVIERTRGLARQVLVSPDEPAAFVAASQRALDQWRTAQHSRPTPDAA